jgi:hypothetical protein
MQTRHEAPNRRDCARKTPLYFWPVLGSVLIINCCWILPNSQGVFVDYHFLRASLVLVSVLLSGFIFYRITHNIWILASSGIIGSTLSADILCNMFISNNVTLAATLAFHVLWVITSLLWHIHITAKTPQFSKPLSNVKYLDLWLHRIPAFLSGVLWLATVLSSSWLLLILKHRLLPQEGHSLKLPTIFFVLFLLFSSIVVMATTVRNLRSRVPKHDRH